jgi:hypothetical protein
MKYEKKAGTYVPKERVISHYEVIVAGIVVFANEVRAICNSYICREMIQGVRSTAVYLEEE